MFGDEMVTREILGHVPTWLVRTFYALALVACGFALLSFWKRIRSYRRAGPASPCVVRITVRERIGRGVRYVVLHEQLRRDPYAGWSHLLVVYGFFILFVGTCLVFLEHDTPLHFYYGWFYQWASLVVDLGGLAFLIGVSMFIARRAAEGTTRLLRAWWVTALGVLLLAIGLSGFLLEGARIAVDLPPHERWSAVGYVLALALRAGGIAGPAAVTLQQGLWAGHAALCVAFFALLPWGFFSHMAYGLASAAGRTDRPLARLATPRLSGGEPPGATAWREFTARDLLQADACTTCGRCNAVCPAATVGKPLRPRDVVLELRRNHTRGGNHGAAGPLDVADDVLWSCTTCAACNQACPVGIDVYDKIVELRRGRVESGRVPPAAEDAFESIEQRSNPFGRRNSERMRWADGLNVPLARAGEQVELLYWIGCSGSFSPEGQSVARAMVKILDHLGTNYRVLGTAERCTGDPARRMGEEGLFQECAVQNLKLLQQHGVKTVLTHCPHCYNTLRNEYPDVAGGATGWETKHHTQFLAEQIGAGRLTGSAQRLPMVAFHDPCYLGRGNGVVAEPRQVLAGLHLPVIELPRHGTDSFCCGAGGGSMWLDVRGTSRIENERYAEAAATGAQVVGTGCPFCKTMLDAARQSAAAVNADAPRVLDVAELVAQAEGL